MMIRPFSLPPAMPIPAFMLFHSDVTRALNELIHVGARVEAWSVIVTMGAPAERVRSALLDGV